MGATSGGSSGPAASLESGPVALVSDGPLRARERRACAPRIATFARSLGARMRPSLVARAGAGRPGASLADQSCRLAASSTRLEISLARASIGRLLPLPLPRKDPALSGRNGAAALAQTRPTTGRVQKLEQTLSRLTDRPRPALPSRRAPITRLSYLAAFFWAPCGLRQSEGIAERRDKVGSRAEQFSRPQWQAASFRHHCCPSNGAHNQSELRWPKLMITQRVLILPT